MSRVVPVILDRRARTSDGVQHDGKPPRTLRSFELLDPGNLRSQNAVVEEQERAQGLVLGGGAHVPLRREVREECGDFRLSHRIGVPLSVVQDALSVREL